MLLLDRLKALVQNKKTLFGLIFITLCLMGGVLYTLLKGEEEKEKDFRPIPVLVEEVRMGSLSRNITIVGTLIANQTVIVRPEMNGIIGKIYVKGGEVVREGEPLFELDDRQIRAELKEAEARLTFTKLEYERASSLASKNFGSQQKLDDAKAKMLMAEAAVESQRVKLDRTILRAPFTGLVSIHGLSIGAVVSPDKELATVVDISPMQVEFRIAAEYLKYINEGQRVEVFIDGYTQDKPTQGIISNIDAKIDPNAHSVIVRALIPNKNANLRPGLFARVNVTVGSKDNTLIISTSSIMSNEGVEQVYKIFEGLAYKVDVRTGIQDGESIEVVTGLAPGDHIVAEGHAKIRDQYPVRYELNGVQYTFNKAKFEEKIKELEARKKAAEEGKPFSEAATSSSNAPLKEGQKEGDKNPVEAKTDQKEATDPSLKAEGPAVTEETPTEKNQDKSKEVTSPSTETKPSVPADKEAPPVSPEADAPEASKVAEPDKGSASSSSLSSDHKA